MLSTYKTKIDDALAETRVLQRDVVSLEQAHRMTEQLVDTRKQSHHIIQVAAQLTQASLQEELGAVVSMALRGVFNDPYEFVVEFVTKRNTTECNLWFERHEEKCRPLDDSGYGAADIASTALRISYWASGETRAVLLLDEPCKNISRAYKDVAAKMFQEMCKKLGLQIIMVTHIPEFRDSADKLFMTKMRSNGVSVVEEI